MISRFADLKFPKAFVKMTKKREKREISVKT